MASGRGRDRGRDRGREFLGRDSIGGLGSYVGRQTVSDKGLRQSKHC